MEPHLGLFVNRDSNKKNISSLAASQKKRALVKEGKFNLIEKILMEIKNDGITEAVSVRGE